MCGVFGFVARGSKSRVDLQQLQWIAEVTMTRGPHAFGFAWVDFDGRMHSFKQAGAIADHLGLLALARNARVLIGHCRFATHGDPADNINNHPHPVDGGWFVHNGVVFNHRQLIRERRLWLNSACDSEVLGQLVEQEDGTAVERWRRAVNATAPGPLATLALERSGRLVAVRRGNPLSIGTTPTGYYLASLRADLPGDVRDVQDETIVEWHGRTMKTQPLRGGGLPAAPRKAPPRQGFIPF